MSSKKPMDPMMYAHRGQDPRYSEKSLDTQCVHAGERWIPQDHTSTSDPVYYSNVFFVDDPQAVDDIVYHRRTGFAYSRWSAPNAVALERAISTLEKADLTLVCSSGMAASNMALLGAGAGQGKTILCSFDTYGSVADLVKNTFAELGARPLFFDFTDMQGLQKVFETEKPDIVYFEVMSNPMLKVVDAPAVIEMGRRCGAKVIVDNTFTTPYLMRPFELGADFVTHSLSKFLSGHGDVLAGSVSFHQEDFERMLNIQTNIGSNLAPNAAFLARRGLKTFTLRMERQCSNALALAKFLEAHPLTERILYPGLPSHPQHEIACRTFANGLFGCMLSFDLVYTEVEKIFAFVEALQSITYGSLGEVHTMITYPLRTTHHTFTEEQLQKAGIKAGTMRLSVGIENIEDLKADLDQALRIGAQS